MKQECCEPSVNPTRASCKLSILWRISFCACACVVSHVCVFACVLVRLLDSVLVSQVPAAGLSEFVSAFMCFLLQFVSLCISSWARLCSCACFRTNVNVDVAVDGVHYVVDVDDVDDEDHVQNVDNVDIMDEVVEVYM